MPKIADIENTPDPNAIKFVLRERIVWGQSRAFDNAEAAQNDPLAAQLFAIAHIVNVLYMDNWVTITQDGQANWADLARQIAKPIRAAEAAKIPERTAVVPSDNEDPRLPAIRQIIEERIRPTLLADGGDLDVMTLCGNLLCIRYYGACGSCPSSQSGTLLAIENLVKTIEPEIEVMAI